MAIRNILTRHVHDEFSVKERKLNGAQGIVEATYQIIEPIAFIECVVDPNEVSITNYQRAAVLQTVDFFLREDSYHPMALTKDDSNRTIPVKELYEFLFKSDLFTGRYGEEYASEEAHDEFFVTEFLDTLRGYGYYFGEPSAGVFRLYSYNANVSFDFDGWLVEANGDGYDVIEANGSPIYMPNMIATLAFIEQKMAEAGYYPDILYSTSGDEYWVIIPGGKNVPCDNWTKFH